MKKIQEIIKNIKTFFYSMVSSQFKKKEIKDKRMSFMEWLECNQYMITFIGLILTFVTIILSIPILYFTLKDRNSNIESTVIISDLPKIHNKLTSKLLIFELKQKSNSISYIENPRVFIRVLYNFSNGLKCGDFDVTDKLHIVNDSNIIILEKMGEIYEFKYQYGKYFIDYVKNNIDKGDILTLKLYLKYYDKSSKNFKVTNRTMINGDLFKYNVNDSYDVSRMLDITKKLTK